MWQYIHDTGVLQNHLHSISPKNPSDEKCSNCPCLKTDGFNLQCGVRPQHTCFVCFPTHQPQFVWHTLVIRCFLSSSLSKALLPLLWIIFYHARGSFVTVLPSPRARARAAVTDTTWPVYLHTCVCAHIPTYTRAWHNSRMTNFSWQASKSSL